MTISETVYVQLIVFNQNLLGNFILKKLALKFFIYYKIIKYGKN